MKENYANTIIVYFWPILARLSLLRFKAFLIHKENFLLSTNKQNSATDTRSGHQFMFPWIQKMYNAYNFG